MRDVEDSVNLVFVLVDVLFLMDEDNGVLICVIVVCLVNMVVLVIGLDLDYDFFIFKCVESLIEIFGESDEFVANLEFIVFL